MPTDEIPDRQPPMPQINPLRYITVKALAIWTAMRESVRHGDEIRPIATPPKTSDATHQSCLGRAGPKLTVLRMR